MQDVNNYTRNGILRFYSGWLMALIAIMLSRLVVSQFDYIKYLLWCMCVCYVYATVHFVVLVY